MKIEICKQCSNLRRVNSRSICPDCVFRNNHEGKNQSETYSERSKLKDKTIVKEIPISKKKLSKTISITKNKNIENRKDVLKQDEQFYELIFNSRPHQCEECGTSLPDQFRDDNGKIIMRSQYSHILGKGAWGKLRHHPLNMNILCFACHQIWDFGEKNKMKIYEPNQILIQEMLDELNSI